jgi:hypothetical protein
MAASGMEYQSKNSKGEEPIQIYLRDISMQVKTLGRDLIIFYSSIERVSLTRRTGSLFSLRFTTIDNKSFTITNKYVHSTGYIEDKSPAYTMFVRVLHMHLKEKSKAQFTCRKIFHIPDWQKLAIVVLLFGISYLFDFMGVKLFHPAIHGAALSAIAILVITVSEKNKGIENPSIRGIPRDYLPV